ncbi:MAG TPA: STAS domain-containing protein [Jatrophihabitans sp.]|nr:STAS domain-containing protein [Jatrophihabitans sp.]
MELHIDTSVRGDWQVVSPAGDIDLHTVPALRECLDDVRAEGHRHIVVDLARVDFLDSSALGLLVSVQRDLDSDSGELKIACPQPQVSKVFRITRLAEVIPIHDSVDEACG